MPGQPGARGRGRGGWGRHLWTRHIHTGDGEQKYLVLRLKIFADGRPHGGGEGVW